jgi:hypothetical protein
MNRLIKYIILLTSCFWIVAAPTCENETSQVDARRDHLVRLEAVSEVFASESLSDDNLEAFEFRAVEKLMDYADYLGIIYSEGYAVSFRQQARQNIVGLFDNKENAEAALIPESFTGPFSSYQIMIDSVDINDPLKRETDTRYTGSMRYVEKILGTGQNDTSLISHSLKSIGITLQMGYKDFGENSLLVWEVHLGKITTAY